MDKSDLIPYLCVWAAAAIVIVWQTWRNFGAGLVLSYCFQLFLLYWIGGAIHALPWSDLPQLDFVILGMQKSTYAMVAFGLGTLVFGPGIASRMQSRAHAAVIPNPKLPQYYMSLGLAFFFVVGPTLGRLQGLNAVAAAGAQLVIVGISLNCWRAWSAGGTKPLLRALAPALLVPVATLIMQGFMSYGVIGLSTILLFSAQFFRPRWILLAIGFIAGWVGLSGYSAYMRDRDELRAAIWGGQSYSNRLERAKQTLESVEWFSWKNPDDLNFVDGRLNQNALVGAAVANLSNTGNFARGSTLVEAVIAMIPRLIWPSKPASAGSGDLASRFTGEEFAAGTSVGVGPVLELYGNFGDVAIWVGFAILGCLLKVLDSMAGWYLQTGDWYNFAVYFLVGISLLNVSGSFVECAAGAVASLVLGRAVNSMLRKSAPYLAATAPVAV
jgi:hypothetical protein